MSLPISQSQAIKAINWLKKNFSSNVQDAIKDTPFSPEIIYGIACQETAYFWINFIDHVSPSVILQRCVLDASGDIKGTSRSVFPKNTQEFIDKYGQDNADILIAEANKTRVMRGFKPANIVYKGYGFLQYDIQAIENDEDFFLQKLWYNVDNCLSRCVNELTEKYNNNQAIWAAIKAYNGAGQSATNYADNVTQYSEWAASV